MSRTRSVRSRSLALTVGTLLLSGGVAMSSQTSAYALTGQAGTAFQEQSAAAWPRHCCGHGWSCHKCRRGRPGPPGPQGPQGEPGRNGVSGWERIEQNFTLGVGPNPVTETVTCSPNKRVLGGGYVIPPEPFLYGTALIVTASAPTGPNTWGVTVNPVGSGEPVTATAYAICADVN
ncbi:hypothetical protein AB0L06_29715 [Spirillospora sp. NPDC052269]